MFIRSIALLLLLWCSPLGAHQAVQDSPVATWMDAISEKVESVIEKQAALYGTEPLEPEREAFIRNIAEELGITKQIIIRKMSRLAITTWGRKNAIALFHKYIFVGDTFFKELSAEERRFLIGHELAHLMCNHPLVQVVTLISLLSISGIISTTLALKLKNKYQFSAAASITTGMLAFALFNRLGHLGNRMLSRQHEKEADFISASRLQSAQGGVAFFTKLPEAYDYSKWLNRLLASHPSHQERIQLLETYIPTPQLQESL